MQIAVKYTVHTVVVERAPMLVDVNGQEIEVQADRLVVELTADEGEHAPTFRLPVGSTQELARQRAAFVVGAAVTLTIDTGDAA